MQSSKQRWFKRKFGKKRRALLKATHVPCIQTPMQKRPNELALTREVDNTLQPSLWNEPMQSASQTTDFSVSYSPLSSSGGVRSCATDPLTQNTTRPICGNRAHRNVFAVYAVDWETLSGTATTLVPRSPQSSSSWPGSPKADGLEWRHSIWPNMSHYTLTQSYTGAVNYFLFK